MRQEAIASALRSPDEFSPSEQQARRELEAAARRWNIPAPLLLAIGWHAGHWKQFSSAMHRRLFYQEGPSARVGILSVPTANRPARDIRRLADDWRANIDEGARQLDACWTRAGTPAPGNRRKIEDWFAALALYGASGTEESSGDAYATAVFAILAHGGQGRFSKIAVRRH